MVVLKGKNWFGDFSKVFWLGKREELLHKSNTSGIMFTRRIAIQRQSKRADSKSGISPKSRTLCSVNVGNGGTLADCTEAFPFQATENLLTLLDVGHPAVSR